MRKSFYCRTHTNTSPFDDSETELIRMDLQDAGWTSSEICDYLHPDTCEKQCERCMNEMLDQRNRTKKLVDSLKNKNV